MNKVSLLAASVAIALAGCGGSDGGSNASNSGIVITGFDGYFKNAVVFVDNNNDGIWNDSDQFLGTTDGKGEIKLDEKPQGTLALQTITPNGSAQAKLINIDKEKYAGIYTIDMDHPAQAMAHELVFRAPNSSSVISPLTDLVAIEMAKGTEENPVTEEDAIAKVNTALGGNEETQIDLFSDFVDGANADPALHKTAQILTESKAANPESYEKKATEFAKEADTMVSKMTPEQITDLNNKPAIEDKTPESETLAPEVIVNKKLIVNEKLFNEQQAKLTPLTENVAFDAMTLELASLFRDEDQPQGVELTLDATSLKDTGIQAVLSGDQLVFQAGTPAKSGTFLVWLSANDLNNKGAEMAQTRMAFALTVLADQPNQAPVVNDSIKAELQTQIDSWQLQAGVQFDGSINIAGLFRDNDGDVVGYWGGEIQVSGLNIPDHNDPNIVISGKPTQAYPAGKTFRVGAEDNEGEKSYVTFKLPEVAESVTPPPSEAHPLEGKTWYQLEHGSSNGEDKQNFSSIWCDSYRFDDGIVYSNIRTPSNLTACSAADTPMEGATYELIDGKLVASFTIEEENSNGEMETFVEKILMDVTTEPNGEDVATGALNVIKHFLDESGSDTGEAESYTFYSNIEDAQARISITSDAGAESRAFIMNLPGEKSNTWVPSMITVALSPSTNTNDSGPMDAGIWFDMPANFTCADVNEFYESFKFTGEDIGTVTSSSLSAPDSGLPECYDGEEEYKYAVIDFDLPELTVGNVYSFIGRVKDTQGAYVEAVKLNIKWTGQGNDE